MSTNCNNTGFYINGTELDIDPTTYEPIVGSQTGSVHMLLDKTILVQKIGGTKTMMRIAGQTASGSVASAMIALASNTNAITVQDYDGNSYSVAVNPEAQGVNVSRMRGVNQGWEYKLEFIHLT